MPSRRGRFCCCFLQLSIIFFCVLIVYLLNYYVVSRFAWAHSRCLLSLVRGTIQSKIECVEAATHERATLDPTLWFRNNKKDNHFHFNHSNTPAAYIHYTLTTEPKSDNDVFSLARCSMEASGQICRQKKNRKCIIQVWIVHQAATSIELHHSTITNWWFEELQITLEPYPHCFRVILGGTADDLLIGSECHDDDDKEEKPTKKTSSSNSNNKIQNDSVLLLKQQLRQWLTSAESSNQIPAHFSDGWRLFVLAQMGGLYLDTDVLPVVSSSTTDDLVITKLPSTTIPTQDKVGAYRLNGGTLRLDDNPEFVKSSSSTTDDLVVTKLPSTTIPTQDKVGAYRLNGGTLRLDDNPEFVKSLIVDHLHWAPLLTQLPQDQQPFGFLGPCALTRVYTSVRQKQMRNNNRLRRNDDGNNHNISILPPSLLEPPLERCPIQGSSNKNRPLALHFSGSRKTHWQIKLKNGCWRDLINATCPRMLQSIENKSKK
eukprot:CAMPEP_0194227606 /NCGR_PEP_ID=MMETSP0156-20130528/42943_1 /TAXON_ID=33649 /ORGANISM="Thalassionema nitzschioides, Strain L26-B" /LENGTH=485 /DNA_ID=CAMNT_0038960093 /DNA_START=156 /DNA_END=1612 /DNA_ORIENTATION=+